MLNIILDTTQVMRDAWALLQGMTYHDYDMDEIVRHVLDALRDPQTYPVSIQSYLLHPDQRGLPYDLQEIDLLNRTYTLLYETFYRVLCDEDIYRLTQGRSITFDFFLDDLVILVEEQQFPR